MMSKDFMPHGIDRRTDETPPELPAAPRGRRWLAALRNVGAVSLTLAGIVFLLFAAGDPGARPGAPRSAREQREARQAEIECMILAEQAAGASPVGPVGEPHDPALRGVQP